MDSTMQDYPLTIGSIMRYACDVHGDRKVTTATGDGYRQTTYREVGEQAARLANALRRIGITGDQRVATFMWNNAEHLTAYLAIPSMGAVMHTLNIRLSPEQIAFIANEAEDQVIIANASVAAQLAAVLPLLETVHTVIVGRRRRYRCAGCVRKDRAPLRRSSRLRNRPPSTGRTSTRGQPRRCATPVEPPETRKVLSTATVRVICIR